jgi:hypothetical protein
MGLGRVDELAQSQGLRHGQTAEGIVLITISAGVVVISHAAPAG